MASRSIPNRPRRRVPQTTDGPGEPREPAERMEKVVIRLAGGKERAINHISATSFWGPDGRPLSAAEFMQSLFGKLPELFRDETSYVLFGAIPPPGARS